MIKRALITGASKGIGRELAKKFAKHGYELLLIARTVSELETLQQELKDNFKVNSKILSLDLSDEKAVDIIVNTFSTEIKSLDVLINNAGYGICSKFADMAASDVQGMLAVNINILTQLTYRVLPHMVTRQNGKILNVASIAAYTPGPYMAMYYASKAYVLSFSEALYEEYRKDNVLISALCPGITPTSFQERAGIEKTRMMKGFVPIMNAEKVAAIAYDGLMKKQSVIITGFVNKLTVFLLSLFPRALAAKISGFISKPKP